eukprot:CAMPEP_0203673014 /NCGR_PEP_ID=MMETSP0090-20130426/10353_1 /ASSEMBLY_ACC=CAM_ASM_001088 /TAXON_ID=426623 /ORGANISM="Chaetoceros affinis, Strain CCMP159" /LENGTH=479 /DNA_ID=CAMNT_0050538527 /DNA_START=86 /DNA_END=1525 /DNA_ORIENTATION=+
MAVKNVNWETIERRLKAHPHEATEEDKFGVTALHHTIRKQNQLCQSRSCGNDIRSSSDSNADNRNDSAEKNANAVPMKIFRLLIDEYPDSLCICDKMTGCNALHVACSSHCSDEMKEVIMMILDTRPDTSMQLCGDGRLPLHRCKDVQIAQRLIDIYPEGLGVVTKKHGYLPLHGACSDSTTSPDVVELLIENGVRNKVGTSIGNGHHCGGLLVKDLHGDIPIKIIFRRVLFLKSSSSSSSFSDETLWKKLCIVVKATYLAMHGLPCINPSPKSKDNIDSYSEHGDIPLVHAIIECGGHTNLVKYTLQLHPEQALWRDRDGRTPLSIACAKNETNNEIINLLIDSKNVDIKGTEDGHGGDNHKNGSKIEEKKVVQGRAAACMADTKGRLPLHLAVASGRTLKNGVELIADAAPLAMQTRDIQTGMYPFQLASIPNYKWDNTCIDTIYSMVRSVPDVLQKYCDDDIDHAQDVNCNYSDND